MGARSLGAPTWLAEAVALAWHAPGGALPPPYQWHRLSLRARAPEQHSGTPSMAISVGTLTRCAHGALPGIDYHSLTNGVAFPFVLKRLRNTPTRPQWPSPRTPGTPV